MKRLDWQKAARREKVTIVGAESDESARVDMHGLGRLKEAKKVSKSVKGLPRPGKLAHVKAIKSEAADQLALVTVKLSRMAARGLSQSPEFAATKRQEARLREKLDPIGEYRKRVGLSKRNTKKVKNDA